MNALQRALRKQTVKYLTALLALLFLFSSVFSFNVLAVGDLIHCDSSHTLERYQELHELIKERGNIASDADLVNNLAITSLCLGEKDEERWLGKSEQGG